MVVRLNFPEAKSTTTLSFTYGLYRSNIGQMASPRRNEQAAMRSFMCMRWRNSLPGRIARLLGQSRPAARAGLGAGMVAAAMLLFLAADGLLGQADPHPAFQTVSIKQNASAWNDRFEHSMGVAYRTGGRLVTQDASLLLLIQFTYGNHENHALPLLASQVIGGPPWMNSIGYDIEAKPASAADPARMWRMTQTLLADRFKLALHRETRELPVYVLRAAKGSMRLPAAKDVECVSFPPGTPPQPVPGKVDCGYVAGPGGRAGGLLEGSKVHMADLIRELGFVMERPVLDRTGFRNDFDLKLSFAADEATEGLRDWLARRQSETNNKPNIFAALEQQLGLKLTADKAPVEVLVVDHAEKPELGF